MGNNNDKEVSIFKANFNIKIHSFAVHCIICGIFNAQEAATKLQSRSFSEEARKEKLTRKPCGGGFRDLFTTKCTKVYSIHDDFIIYFAT